MHSFIALHWFANSHLLPESGVADLAGVGLLLPVHGGDVLLDEPLGGGRVAALVAVVGPVLEVHGVHVLRW